MESLELVPICKAFIPIREAIVVEGTPQGTLMVGELRDSRFEGERFTASQRGHAAADWLNVSPDGDGGGRCSDDPGDR